MSRNAGDQAGGCLVWAGTFIGLLLIGPPAQAQIGCTREEVQAQLNGLPAPGPAIQLGADTIQLEFGKADRDFRAQCTITFEGDRAARVRWNSFSFDNSWAQAKNVLATSNWHALDGKREKAEFELDFDCCRLFPQIGAWSVRFVPIMRTIGRQKVVTIDLNTGSILSEAPWSDISVPTGGVHVIKATKLFNVAVWTNPDRRLHAMLVASSRSFGGFRDEQVESVEFFTADAFWRKKLEDIGRTYGLYETELAEVIPGQVRAQVQQLRFSAAIAMAVDRSDLRVDLLREHMESAVAKEPVFAQLSKKIAVQPVAAQRRRLAFLEPVYEKDAIRAIVPLMRLPEARKTEAATVLQRLAARHGLPPTPAAKDSFTQWSRWAREAGVGR